MTRNEFITFTKEFWELEQVSLSSDLVNEITDWDDEGRIVDFLVALELRTGAKLDVDLSKHIPPVFSLASIASVISIKLARKLFGQKYIPLFLAEIFSQVSKTNLSS